MFYLVCKSLDDTTIVSRTIDNNGKVLGLIYV